MVDQCIYIVMYIKSWPAAEIRLHLYEISRLIIVDLSAAYSNEAHITSCMYEPAHAYTQRYGTADQL